MQLKWSERKQIITTYDREVLVRSIRQLRRAILRDFVVNMFHTFSDFDFSLPQLATLFVLDEEGEMSVKQVAEFLQRSVSVASRLLDQLVERGLVSRREDTQDRRAKRIAITEQGSNLIAMLEQRRAEAQLVVMEYLSTEEQADVTRAMVLLAEAGLRRRTHERPETRSSTDEGIQDK